jgi:hypothetical protein
MVVDLPVVELQIGALRLGVLACMAFEEPLRLSSTS